MSAEFVKLGQLLAVPPASIEILPVWLAEDAPGETNPHAPFLLIEGNLGVPKKLAYKVYLEGVSIFRRCRERLRRQHRTASTASSPDALVSADVAETLASSSVLLLVNAAHQSALNARKRLVQHGMLGAAQEIQFVSALLTLHEAAKQSILWHHRRWLLRRIHRTDPPSSSSVAQGASAVSDTLAGDREDSLCGLVMAADALRGEFAVVAQACEIYPRNYYAWAHRYLCAEALAALLRGGAGRDAAAGLLGVWKEEKGHIRRWIERHVSDYSAMQYACLLEDLDRGLRELGHAIAVAAGGHMEVSPSEEKESVCEHAWSLVKTYPSHEALWLYLRGSLDPLFKTSDAHPAPGTSDRVRDDVRALAMRVLSGGRADDRSNALSGEDALVRDHATRFLAWLRWKDGKLVLGDGVVLRIAQAAATGTGGDAIDYLGLSGAAVSPPC